MKIQKINVHLKGIKPIIFNEYVSKDDTNIPPMKKIAFEGSKVVIRPDRIMSFLIDNNTALPAGCVKLFVDMKKYKILLPKVKAYVGLPTENIPIANKKDIIIREDKVNGGGVPNMVKRPMINNWEAKFSINLIENPDITFEKLENWINRGGIEVGFGAWRPLFGQFIVEKFEKIE